MWIIEIMKPKPELRVNLPSTTLLWRKDLLLEIYTCPFALVARHKVLFFVLIRAHVKYSVSVLIRIIRYRMFSFCRILAESCTNMDSRKISYSCCMARACVRSDNARASAIMHEPCYNWLVTCACFKRFYMSGYLALHSW